MFYKGLLNLYLETSHTSNPNIPCFPLTVLVHHMIMKYFSHHGQKSTQFFGKHLVVCLMLVVLEVLVTWCLERINSHSILGRLTSWAPSIKTDGNFEVVAFFYCHRQLDIRIPVTEEHLVICAVLLSRDIWELFHIWKSFLTCIGQFCYICHVDIFWQEHLDIYCKSFIRGQKYFGYAKSNYSALEQSSSISYS